MKVWKPVMRRLWGQLCLLFAIIALCGAGPIRNPDDVKVTIVLILATEKDEGIDCELKEIAKAIQRKHPHLKSFRLEEMSRKHIPVGKSETFPLIEKQVVTVAIRHATDEKGQVGIAIRAPMAAKEIDYTTCCSKYLPIVTKYRTTEHEYLILAISIGCKPKPPPEPAKE
jgi:hypothetical protein